MGGSIRGHLLFGVDPHVLPPCGDAAPGGEGDAGGGGKGLAFADWMSEYISIDSSILRFYGVMGGGGGLVQMNTSEE